MAYRPYRGTRARKRNRLLLAFTFILLLLIIGGVVFFALQEHIIFTADGFRFDFSTSTEPPATEPSASESLPPVIIEQTTTQAPTEPPTEPPVFKDLTAALHIKTGDDYQQGLPGGILQRAIYVKDIDGVVRIATDGESPTALSDFFASEPCVALISVFRDHEGAAANRSAAVTVSGGKTWLDIGYYRWLNPFVQTEGSGLAKARMLVAACAAQGASEVVLTNFQFPTQGHMSYIDWGIYAQSDRMAAMNDTAKALRDSMEDDDLYLSCLLTETAASTFVDEPAGQSVLELAQYFDILYVPTADPDYDTGPLYELIGGTGCRIGLWLRSNTAPSREIDFILAP